MSTNGERVKGNVNSVLGIIPTCDVCVWHKSDSSKMQHLKYKCL